MNSNNIITPELQEYIDIAKYEDLVEQAKNGIAIDDPDDIEFLWDVCGTTPEIMEIVYG